MRVHKWTGYAALAGLLAFFVQGTPSRAMALREALAHFESGATKPTKCSADFKIGSRKEVSRFQILPTVWRQYTKAADYRDPETAWSVTERILTDRYNQFRAATGRDWDAVDLYIMWNAPGVYERARWNRSRVSRVVLERAERFANLVSSDERLLVRANVE